MYVGTRVHSRTESGQRRRLDNSRHHLFTLSQDQAGLASTDQHSPIHSHSLARTNIYHSSGSGFGLIFHNQPTAKHGDISKTTFDQVATSSRADGTQSSAAQLLHFSSSRLHGAGVPIQLRNNSERPEPLESQNFNHLNE